MAKPYQDETVLAVNQLDPLYHSGIPDDPPCPVCSVRDEDHWEPHPMSDHERRMFGSPRCYLCTQWGGPCA